MWILVMFDLPVGSREEMRKATKFREFLLDQGFEKCQFSVYARFCNGKERYRTYLRRIEEAVPPRGDVQILHFTDKQYEQTVRFSNRGRQAPRTPPDQLVLF